jgi:transposase-like protein
MWWVVTQKTGGSAKGLQRLMGLGSYQTAWTWLHKLRRAMVRAGREKLSGSVEVDEAWVGGSEKGATGRQTRTKSQIVVGVEFEGTRIGRVRTQVIPDGSKRTLSGFIIDNIEKGSRIVTDGWQGYATLEDLGYRHTAHTIGTDASQASKLLPRVHRVIALIKRWLLGTHQGRCSRKYMQAYMDEFAFRFNRRKSRHVGNLFRRMLQQVGQSKPLTYRQLSRTSKTVKPQ